LGEVFNLGNPDAACSARELATLIRDLAGSSSPIVDVAPVFDDVEDRVPSIRKARARLGYEPRVGLREGLGRTVGWYERRIHASPGARPRS
jgi:nucleoside-diphosphate-sugar epimerase